MLPKAYLTLCSRMSGSSWLITASWLSGPWRSFLYSSVYSCHLFLISPTSVRSIKFLSFIVTIIAWNVLGISNFLEEISHLPHSIVFLYFFALITEDSFLISPCSFGSLHANGLTFPFLFLPLVSLLFSALCKASWGNHLASLHFFLLGMVLIPSSCTKSGTTVHNWSDLLYYQI